MKESDNNRKKLTTEPSIKRKTTLRTLNKFFPPFINILWQLSEHKLQAPSMERFLQYYMMFNIGGERGENLERYIILLYLIDNWQEPAREYFDIAPYQSEMDSVEDALRRSGLPSFDDKGKIHFNWDKMDFYFHPFIFWVMFVRLPSRWRTLPDKYGIFADIYVIQQTMKTIFASVDHNRFCKSYYSSLLAIHFTRLYRTLYKSAQYDK